MRGVVMIHDGDVTHVIPRAEVRHVELYSNSGDNWTLRYSLTGATSTRCIEWLGDSRHTEFKDKESLSAGEHNKCAARALRSLLTFGEGDLLLVRRSTTDVFVILPPDKIDEHARVALCRQFITEMALTARQTAIGPLDDVRRQMLHEIHTAARDLVLPDWYPLKDETL